VLGAGASASDATALGYFNAIRTRAGLDSISSFTFTDILHERRVEFCLESMFWYDIKRYFYRDAAAALDYVNSQEREYTYTEITGSDDPNSWDSYEVDSTENSYTLYESQMFLPIPAAEVLVNPKLSEDAVEYEFD